MQGVKICKKGPAVSHMLFADDIYLFCKADSGDANRVTEILNVYERASGQRVNKEKPTVFFSANIIQYNRDMLCQELQINEADETSKYLGLPNVVGRNKSALFGYLKEKFKASILNWNEKNLSKPSKEILIKMVAQSLPSYAMNVFLLPLGVIREIEKELTRFFWKTSQNSTSQIHRMAWERLAHHEHAGGLGFKSLRDFNLDFGQTVFAAYHQPR